MSLWLAVKVVCCSRVLFGSKIIDCTGVESFGTLLSTLGDEHFVCRCVVVKCVFVQSVSCADPMRKVLQHGVLAMWQPNGQGLD